MHGEDLIRLVDFWYRRATRRGSFSREKCSEGHLKLLFTSFGSSSGHFLVMSCLCADDDGSGRKSCDRSKSRAMVCLGCRRL